METPLLHDKEIFPTDEIILSHIGRVKKLWIELFEYIHKTYPDFTDEWRYYNDGKSWLLKVSRKSKTICWISIIEGAFRMTFYFNVRAEESIFNCAISEELKEQFRNGKWYGKIRGLTITFWEKQDLDFAKILLEIKRKAK